MATYNVASGNWTYELVVTETAVNTEANTSTLSVTAYIYRTSQYIQNLHYTTKVTISGTQKTIGNNVNVNHTFSSSSPRVNIGSGTFTVEHNEDGSKSAAISVSYDNTDNAGSPGDASGGTWYLTLTKINRNPLIYLKREGSYTTGKAYVKAGGAWKKASKVFVKVNGTWKEDIKKG